MDLLVQKSDNLRDRGIIIMGLYCGFRISESVNFQWNLVDYENKTISVKENIKPIKWNPKYWSLRTVYPNNVVFEFLKV